MIKVKDGYAKLVGTTASGSASHILLSNGGIKAVSDFAAASALDNYLPLSGGTIEGGSGNYTPLIVESKSLSEVWLNFKDTVGNTYIGSDKGQPAVYIEGDHNYLLIHSGNYYNYALPLTGGTLTNSYEPLIVKRLTDTGASFIRYHNNEGLIGTIGVGGSASSFPYDIYFQHKSGSSYKIWHEGNDGSGSGLDADLLDGQQGSWYQGNIHSFARINYTSSSVHDANVAINGMLYNYGSSTYWRNTPDMSYGQILTLKSYGNNELMGQLAWDIRHNESDTTRYLWWRAIQNESTISNAKWHQIAFTDSNVASATKLQTARTIWGQSFDGTGNVSGALSNVSEILFKRSGKIDEWGNIHFTSTTGTWSIVSPTFGDIIYVDNNTGNVGIGTTSPTTKLDVHGALKIFDYIDIREPNTKNRVTAYAYSGIGRLYSYNDDSGYNDLYVGQNSTSAIVIKANGNVGIGTGSPAYKLDVNGTISANSSNAMSLKLNSSNISYGFAYNAIGIYHSNVQKGGLGWNSEGKGLTNAGLYLKNYVSGDCISLFNEGGICFIGSNVGIGTASPTKKLHIYSDSSSYDSLVLLEKGGAYDVRFELANSIDALRVIQQSSGNAFISLNGNHSLNLETSNTVRFTIDGSGNVGIGTPTPGYKLHVAGTTFSTGFVKSESSDSYVLLGGGGHKAVSDFAPVSHSHSYVSTGGMVNGAYAVIPTYNGETGWHRIATIDGGTGYGSWILYLCGNWSWASNTNAILHINTMHTTARITQVSGIVGFATDVRLVPISANNYYVDVYINYSGANPPGTVYCYFLGNGAITTRTTVEKITASVSTAASITLVTGTKTNDSSYAAHFYENSDIRYKTIINNLAIKVNQLANLPLFDFKWLDNEDLLNTGTSAQAVQELLPYIVSGTDKLTLDYGVLGTIAGITACKELTEQEKEINELKEQIKFLKDEINNLKTNKLWQS